MQGETPTAWDFGRLEREEHFPTWAAAKGAFLVGGRWSSPGPRVIHVALEPATAILWVAGPQWLRRGRQRRSPASRDRHRGGTGRGRTAVRRTQLELVDSRRCQPEPVEVRRRARFAPARHRAKRDQSAFLELVNQYRDGISPVEPQE